MARITVQDFTTALNVSETYDIMNAIRNSASDNFQRYVPLASADNVTEVGAGLLLSQTLQNEFITSLVERIGLVVMRNTLLNNPLKKFKKGMMPLGRKIEEIFTDITKAKQYDPEDSEQTLFKREIPNVHTLFHEVNRKEIYDQTIQDESLRSAFTSWGDFEGFLSSIIQAIYNSSEVSEYNYMMLLADNYYSKGLFTVVPVTKPDTETASKEFIKKVRATARKMSLPQGTRDYNALAVRTKTDMNDMHLLITADLEAEVDVDVLARAFNMSKTDFVGNVTVIDKFASPGVEAILVDKEWYMVYDTLQKMESVRNSKGLYWNYFFHVWQVLSVSRFANAVAFVSGSVPAITNVIVDPSILSIKQGGSFEYTSYVRVTDGGDYPVTWTVEAGQGTSLAAGTAIDAEGVLTVGATQTGNLIVKGTASYSEDGGSTFIDVDGESLVTVVPVL